MKAFSLILTLAISACAAILAVYIIQQSYKSHSPATNTSQEKSGPTETRQSDVEKYIGCTWKGSGPFGGPSLVFNNRGTGFSSNGYSTHPITWRFADGKMLIFTKESTLEGEIPSSATLSEGGNSLTTFDSNGKVLAIYTRQ